MNLYSCRFTWNDDYQCLVVTSNRVRAKLLFWKESARFEGDWKDLRVRRLQRNVPYAEGVYVSDDESWTWEWYCKPGAGFLTQGEGTRPCTCQNYVVDRAETEADEEKQRKEKEDEHIGRVTAASCYRGANSPGP